MNRAPNRTADQVRADARAEVARTLGTALASDACARNARVVWADAINVSTTHLDNCVHGTKALHVADAMLAPEAVRLALAQLLAGDGHAIVELPTSTDQSDDFRLIATVQRESGEAISATLEAIADGRIGADEGARLVKECDEAIASLLAVRERGRSAVRNRVVEFRAVKR